MYGLTVFRSQKSEDKVSAGLVPVLGCEGNGVPCSSEILEFFWKIYSWLEDTIF